MDLHELNQYKSQILALAAKHGAENVRVFGSVARGEAREDSDIDFLVHMLPDSGFGIGGLYEDLTELLGRKVDVVHDTSVHWYIRDRVLQESVAL